MSLSLNNTQEEEKNNSNTYGSDIMYKPNNNHIDSNSKKVIANNQLLYLDSLKEYKYNEHAIHTLLMLLDLTKVYYNKLPRNKNNKKTLDETLLFFYNNYLVWKSLYWNIFFNLTNKDVIKAEQNLKETEKNILEDLKKLDYYINNKMMNSKIDDFNKLYNNIFKAIQKYDSTNNEIIVEDKNRILEKIEFNKYIIETEGYINNKNLTMCACFSIEHSLNEEPPYSEDNKKNLLTKNIELSHTTIIIILIVFFFVLFPLIIFVLTKIYK